MSIQFHHIANSALTKSAGWSSSAFTGSKDGTVVSASGIGQTIAFTTTDTDVYLVAPPAETYDARLQVNIDGVDTRVINLRGIENHNPAGMAQETVTVYPIAFGLDAGLHTVVLTTLDNVQYKIDSVESKIGTIPLDHSSLLGMGDSITYQGGSPVICNTGFTGYVTQLCSYYGKTQVNFSEGSATIDQIAANYWSHAKLFATHPSMMTLMGGVNDYFDGITDTQIIPRLGDLIDMVRNLAPGIEIRLGGITYLNSVTYPNGNAITAPMNSAIYGLAVSKGLYYADTPNAYTANSYVVDGVHPNSAGHSLLFQAFRDAVPVAATTVPANGSEITVQIGGASSAVPAPTVPAAGVELAIERGPALASVPGSAAAAGSGVAIETGFGIAGIVTGLPTVPALGVEVTVERGAAAVILPPTQPGISVSSLGVVSLVSGGAGADSWFMDWDTDYYAWFGDSAPGSPISGLPAQLSGAPLDGRTTIYVLVRAANPAGSADTIESAVLGNLSAAASGTEIGVQPGFGAIVVTAPAIGNEMEAETGVAAASGHGITAAGSEELLVEAGQGFVSVAALAMLSVELNMEYGAAGASGPASTSATGMDLPLEAQLDQVPASFEILPGRYLQNATGRSFVLVAPTGHVFTLK